MTRATRRLVGSAVMTLAALCGCSRGAFRAEEGTPCTDGICPAPLQCDRSLNVCRLEATADAGTDAIRPAVEAGQVGDGEAQQGSWGAVDTAPDIAAGTTMTPSPDALRDFPQESNRSPDVPAAAATDAPQVEPVIVGKPGVDLDTGSDLPVFLDGPQVGATPNSLSLAAGATSCSSTNYKAVLTLGQSPGGNMVLQSTSYRLVGGLIGATQ